MAEGNGNPRFYEEYFSRAEALACKEQLQMAIPGLELKVTDNTWGPQTTGSHTAYGYLHSWLVFLNNGRFVAQVRSEKELDDFIMVARTLVNVGMFDYDKNAAYATTGKAFRDQNGEWVHDGAVYGIDEQGELYELEAPGRMSDYE